MFLRKIKGNLLFSAGKKERRRGGERQCYLATLTYGTFFVKEAQNYFFCFELEKGKSKEQKKNVAIKTASK